MSFFIRNLGLQSYETIYKQMHDFTEARTLDSQDEIWFVEHPAIYTFGKTALAEHLLKKNEIPIFNSDRGGQITFHAQGQQIMYVLIDLKRNQWQVRDIVTALEQAVILTLKEYQIKSYAKKEAPGVYVDHKKIASLGLSIKKRCTLHGLALNIDMDLTPFLDINPCGYAGLLMTQLSDFTHSYKRETINQQLLSFFIDSLPKLN